MIHFFFPKVCSLCDNFLEKEKGLFCRDCSFYFEPLDPRTRCFYCFCESEERLCEACAVKKEFLIPRGALWENRGPLTTFIHKLKREEQPAYIKLVLSFLVLQLPRLCFPKPDFIIPVPYFFFYNLWKGIPLNNLIAQQISKAMKIPYKNWLLSFSLQTKNYRLKRRADIFDKRILLIDIGFAEKDTWNALRDCLWEENPKSVMGLTLCSQ